METKVLSELKEIKKLLLKITGTSDLPANQSFSKKALEKSDKEFRELKIERDEWISDYDLLKIFPNAPWRCGKLLIEKFEFTNYFTYKRALYFNKKDLLALKKELKKRNINLERYAELLEEEEKFKKKIKEIKQVGIKGKRFRIPEELKDIELTKCAPPDIEIVKNHIEKLKKEFEEKNLSEFVDLYESRSHLKVKYYYERYIDKDKLKICKKWCNDYNYANGALREIINAKSY